MRSVVADAPFIHTILEFEVENSRSEGEDEFGNPVYGSRPIKLEAIVAPSKSQHLQRLEGHDPKLLFFKGELIEPLHSPHLKIGAKCRFCYNTQHGTLTITNVILNDVIGVAFGSYFAGDFLID